MRVTKFLQEAAFSFLMVCSRLFLAAMHSSIAVFWSLLLWRDLGAALNLRLASVQFEFHRGLEVLTDEERVVNLTAFDEELAVLFQRLLWPAVWEHLCRSYGRHASPPFESSASCWAVSSVFCWWWTEGWAGGLTRSCQGSSNCRRRLSWHSPSSHQEMSSLVCLTSSWARCSRK